MTPPEQEKLFADLREMHPNWTARFCSGYVHGAQDETKQRKPRSGMLVDARHLDHYALGYLTGFAVHCGPDAEQESWFGFAGMLIGRDD